MSLPGFTEIKIKRSFSMFYFNNLVRDVKKSFSSYILDNICKDTPRTTSKFILDVAWGIMVSGSSKISNISRALYEDNIRVTENRLTKNLMEMDLTKIKENFCEYAFKDLLKINPTIVVDESDVVKPCGIAFEGLSYVHDGSKPGRPKEKGWPLTSIVSLTDDNYVVPLITNIYSSVLEGYKSINDELQKHLNIILPNIYKEHVGTVVLDRGYDGSLYVEYLERKTQFYTIRAKVNRKYSTSNGRMNIESISKKYKGRYSFTFVDRDGNKIYAKASSVKVRHKDFKNELWLVIETVLSEKDVRVYLTNIDCSTKEGVSKTLKAYRSRWRVEEYFRFVKQEYGLEKFMIRSIKAINNLFLCINLVTSFITSIIQNNHRFYKKIEDVYRPLSDVAKEEYIEEKFGRHGLNLYRGKIGLQIILGHTVGRPKIPGRDRKKKYIQMSLF